MSIDDKTNDQTGLNITNSTIVEVIEEEEEQEDDLVVQSDELNKNTIVSKIYVIV